MKRFILPLILVLVNPVYAQIPVTDGASITARATEHVATLEKWVKQFEQLEREYEKIEETFDAMTGVRGLGDIFDDPTLRQYLPLDWRQFYRAIQRGDVSAATKEAREILEDGMTLNPCEIEILPEHVKAQCEARRIKPAQDIALAITALEATDLRAEQVRALQAEINATEDPKAIAELQARLSAERALIENESTRLGLAEVIARAEDRMIEVRRQELQARTFDSTGGLGFEPMTFGTK